MRCPLFFVGLPSWSKLMSFDHAKPDETSGFDCFLVFSAHLSYLLLFGSKEKGSCLPI